MGLLRLPTEVRETELRHDGARGACQTDEQSITQEDSYWPHRLGGLCLLLDCREIQGCPTQDVPLLQVRASKGQAHPHREASHLRGLRSRQGCEPHRLQARAPPRQLESRVWSHCSFVSLVDGKRISNSYQSRHLSSAAANPTKQQQQKHRLNINEFALSLSLYLTVRRGSSKYNIKGKFLFKLKSSVFF